MGSELKIGILRETKDPPDRRVPLTPQQIVSLRTLHPYVDVYVQPGDIRCFSDREYRELGIPVTVDLSNCDILLGVKEVDQAVLIPGKKYLFFAHVGKKQDHNRDMLRVMAEEKITLIDYEYLTKDNGDRIVAFGRWAGIVGAYNGLMAYGMRTKKFFLKPAYQCHDLEEMWSGLPYLSLDPGLKIIVTGKGRVSGGAGETLKAANITQVSPEDFLNKKFDNPVFCMIGPEYYTRHSDGREFSFDHFVTYPEEYESAIQPFAKTADILITGHYWDPRAPVFFAGEDMKMSDFRISVIADISCDINGPIPSTLRVTTISDPFYGYNPFTGSEEPAFLKPGNITVMAVDNLPAELPRDASLDFGRQLIENVLNEILSDTGSEVIRRATILRDGILTPRFEYLRDYLDIR